MKAPSCFVMTPFKFDAYYRQIYAPAISEAGLIPVWGNDLCKFGETRDRIRRAISDSKVCLADISGLNTNVIYEIGFARALSKPVILLIRESEKDKLPFDLATFHVEGYGPDQRDKKRLRKWMQEAIREAMDTPSERLIDAQAIALAGPGEEKDFLAFFGSRSLSGEYKAVFFDAQLPRLEDFTSYLRRSAAGLDSDLLKSIETRWADQFAKHKDKDLCIVRVNRRDDFDRLDACALPKGIHEIIPWRELEAVWEIDGVFQRLGSRMLLWPDRFQKGEWPSEGCLSIGLGFNRLTVRLGDVTGAYRVDYGDLTDDFCIFDDHGEVVDPRRGNGLEYALLARVLLDSGSDEPTPYLVCAGHTADGTAAACRYLGKRWRKLLQDHREVLKDHHMADILYHPRGERDLGRDIDQVQFRHYRDATPIVQRLSRVAP
jgi:hypothetical protein